MNEIFRIFGISVLTVTAVLVGNMLPTNHRLHQMAQASYRHKLDKLLDRAVKQIHLLTIQTRAIESELDSELRINEYLLRDIKELRTRMNELEESNRTLQKQITKING